MGEGVGNATVEGRNGSSLDTVSSPSVRDKDESRTSPSGPDCLQTLSLFQHNNTPYVRTCVGKRGPSK